MPYPLRKERPPALTPTRAEAVVLVDACHSHIRNPATGPEACAAAASVRDQALRYIRLIDSRDRVDMRKANQESHQ